MNTEPSLVRDTGLAILGQSLARATCASTHVANFGLALKAMLDDLALAR